MSLSHQHQQLHTSDHSDDDSGSDLDLDLAELDPATSPGLSRPQNAGSGNHDYGSRIPLRTLRAGRARERQMDSDEDHEDTLRLLEDGPETKPDSDGSAASREADTPLLGSLYSRRRTKQTAGTLSRLGSSLRLGSSDRTLRATSPGAESADEHDQSTNRTIAVGQRQPTRFPMNAVSNSRYTPWTFLPRTLYNEFKFFINIYFLLVALSQFIPQLRIGYIVSYILPLVIVLAVTLGKEAWDDVGRRRRDAEANAEPYTVLNFDAPVSGKKSRLRKKKAKTAVQGQNGYVATNGNGDLAMDKTPDRIVNEIVKPSKDIKVGDIVKLSKDQRVPADLVILQTRSQDNQVAAPRVSTHQLLRADSAQLIETDDNATPAVPVDTEQHGPDKSDDSGEAFIRTDQLDGETDWKLRMASPLSQMLELSDLTLLRVIAGKPDRKVNEFIGTIELTSKLSNDAPDAAAPDEKSAPLTVDNTAWANTVVASSGTVYGVVVYTGSQTRQALSTSASRAKTGLLELEINNLTKILCGLTLSISIILVLLGRIEHTAPRPWYIAALRFLILFSTVIPISLRVNLDMGKIVYAWYIEHDRNIPGTVVRTSTIPEDLGRVEYLLSDKTGTLTQNEMELKKVHVGTVSYANEAMDEVTTYVNQAFTTSASSERSSGSPLVTPSSTFQVPTASATRTRRAIGTRVRDIVLALALCHNVTPTTEESADGQAITTYQASSPDEIAIVRWTEAVGLKLLHRDRTSIVLQSSKTDQVVVRVRILNIFPFTSEGKRMGIVVKFAHSDTDMSTDINEDSEIWFYQKGADTVMSSIVAPSDWLDEETGNMAREGLRTLVIGRKKISPAQYTEFCQQYSKASLVLHGRDNAVGDVVKAHLESDLELLGITGVEDKLQIEVKGSLELLRNAGIKIWMLTGDKVETARCIALSSKLVSRGQHVHTIAKVTRKDAALNALQPISSNTTSALLIDGESLAVMLAYHSRAFITIAARLPAVIACRVSPTQKAELANLVKAYSGKRICCIGDGGNDVSMIQAADVGVGIVGKEGKQASLAADFSIEQFRYLTKLLVWHGRNSYKRSAKLGQFVIHRGFIVSVCQIVFSVASKFGPNALYRDWLMIGYATVYTFAPVFTLVLDRDVDEPLSTLYPELYKDLTSNRSLSYRTFFIWLGISTYQGIVIQGLSQLLISKPLSDQFNRMLAVSYTALVLNELCMVAVEITTWHPIMIAAILATAAAFAGSIPFLGSYMDLAFLKQFGFYWRVAVILAISLGPTYAAKVIGRRVRPPNYRKVMHV